MKITVNKTIVILLYGIRFGLSYYPLPEVLKRTLTLVKLVIHFYHFSLGQFLAKRASEREHRSDSAYFNFIFTFWHISSDVSLLLKIHLFNYPWINSRFYETSVFSVLLYWRKYEKLDLLSVDTSISADIICSRVLIIIISFKLEYFESYEFSLIPPSYDFLSVNL